MTYFPQINNTGIEALIQYPNAVTNGVFGVAVIVVFFIVLFLGIKSRGYETEKALAGSGFPAAVVSYVMVAAGFLSAEVSIIMTVIAVIALVFLYRFSA